MIIEHMWRYRNDGIVRIYEIGEYKMKCVPDRILFYCSIHLASSTNLPRQKLINERQEIQSTQQTLITLLHRNPVGRIKQIHLVHLGSTEDERNSFKKCLLFHS